MEVDPAVRIGEKFTKLIGVFNKLLKNEIGYFNCGRLNTRGNIDWEDGIFLEFCSLGNRCAFRIDFLGESSEDVGTDFVDPDQIRNPNYIEGFTNFVNEVNQGLEEYENELEEKSVVIYHNDYGSWFPAIIEYIYLARETCHYECDYGTSDYIPSHNVRCHAEECHDCPGRDLIPVHYMKIHRDPAVHLGHEVAKFSLKFDTDFLRKEVKIRGFQTDVFNIVGWYQIPQTRTFEYRYEIRLFLLFDDGEKGETNSANIIFPNVRDGGVTPLQKFERDILNQIFVKFDETLRGNMAIVSTENVYHDWRVVRLWDIRIEEKGCAIYFVEYQDDNTFDWVEAHKVRRNHRRCRYCTDIMFVPNNGSDEDQAHERAHEMAEQDIQRIILN